MSQSQRWWEVTDRASALTPFLVEPPVLPTAGRGPTLAVGSGSLLPGQAGALIKVCVGRSLSETEVVQEVTRRCELSGSWSQCPEACPGLQGGAVGPSAGWGSPCPGHRFFPNPCLGPSEIPSGGSFLTLVSSKEKMER